MNSELLDQLSAHQTLGSAPRAELAWLAAHGTVQNYPEGAVLTKKGEQVLAMYIVLSGRIVIYVDRGAGPKKVMEWNGGDVTGILPYSRLTGPPGDNVALSATTVLAIPREDIREMTRECYEVTSILVHKMIDRAKQFESSDRHDEKMVSLGRLSAGLAHELNNPAAAIERTAALLEDRLDESERAALALGSARLDDKQFAAIQAVRQSCMAMAQRGVLSPIEQTEREDGIADWLERHGVDPSLSNLLSETAVSLEALAQLAGFVEGPSLETVLRWAAAGCSVRSLTSEVQDAALRISGLVAAVKGFTHMDQGRSAESVDLATALQNTVTVLRLKARTKKVAIGIALAEGLPHACGFGGELNQIFSNLIDNALDAVPESGRVDVSAVRERDRVVVRVVDNGPGIPPDVQERMFEPFFTTKPVGQGTGLGLDIVRRLLGQNNGIVEVDSHPGRTEFSVSLPIAGEPARGQA